MYTRSPRTERIHSSVAFNSKKELETSYVSGDLSSLAIRRHRRNSNGIQHATYENKILFKYVIDELNAKTS